MGLHVVVPPGAPSPTPKSLFSPALPSFTRRLGMTAGDGYRGPGLKVPKPGRCVMLSSSVLFQSCDKSVVLLDIPRALEESQVPPGRPPTHRIYSDAPPTEPFPTPEPKRGTVFADRGPSSAAVTDLISAAAVANALQLLARHYSGPYHLPRLARASLGQDLAPGSNAGSCDFMVPPGARFLHGSISATRQAFLDASPMFDLVVLDPPWPNRSARRRRRHADRYATANTLHEVRKLLIELPVRDRLAPDGIVAIWITNKPSIRRLLTDATDGVLACWGLELTTEWIWLKVAASGKPLYDVESVWRKPWEMLLIARPRGSRPLTALAPKVIVAAPDVHSRKPNLRPVFQDLLGSDYAGLEVFARNLTAGWWSWGDEVLKFQAPHHWHTAAVCEQAGERVPLDAD